MSLLGKVDAAIIGVVIFGMGLAGGWNLRESTVLTPKRGSMLMPDKDHGVYCVIKSADVVCRFTPPDWSVADSSVEQKPAQAPFQPSKET